MHVVLVGAGLVVMTRTVYVHQVKLIDDAEFLERFESAVDGCQMQAGHLLLGAPQDFRGIKVLAGFLKNLRNDFPLWGKAEAMLPELGSDGATLFEVYSNNHF